MAKEINIPNGWCRRTIGDCIVERKKSPIKVDDAANFGPYPFFTSGENVLMHTDKLVDGENIFLATGGVANVKYFNGDAAYSTDTYSIKTKEDIDTKFLYYALSYLKEFININYFQGSGLKHLQKRDLKKHEFILPKSIDEQRKIAAVLTQADDAISKTEATIAKYETVKTGMMQDLLTRGIDEHGRIRSEATHKFKDSPLGRIPEEWECVLLSTLMDAIDAQPDHRTPAAVEEGFPYVGISDIDEFGNISEKCRRVGWNVIEKQHKAFQIEDGNIIFGKIGTIGKPKLLPIIDTPYAISANVIVIKPHSCAKYLYYALNSSYVSKEVDMAIHSTSQPAFGMEKIRNLEVLKPSIGERNLIAEIITSIDDTIKRETVELEKNIELSIGLLHDLITGSVRV